MILILLDKKWFSTILRIPNLPMGVSVPFKVVWTDATLFVTILFSLTRLSHLPGIGGVQVLEFQKDGVASTWTKAEYRGQVDRDWKMNSLTMCARFKIFFLHVRGTFLQLEDTIDGLDFQILGRKYSPESFLWLIQIHLKCYSELKASSAFFVVCCLDVLYNYSEWRKPNM